ncbi:MAG TPA: hypothetical protein DDY49_09475 [Paenibacillaceae bacterium]|nr:hypothetical protein [Paenibacillaceae bacterium]
MGNEEGFIMWETIYSIMILSLVLIITPLFLEVVEGGNKKRGMDHSVHQLAQSLLEGWKNGDALISGEKRGADGREFYVDVSLMKESICVERCQLTIHWQGINHREEIRTITGYRYVNTEISNE